MSSEVLVFLFLGAIAGAEAVAATVGPPGGVVFYLVILFGMLLSSARAGEPGSGRLFLALGLAPLIRIVSLGMPLAEFSDIYRYVLISVPVLVGVFAVARALDLKPRDIGLVRGAVAAQLLIAITGVVLGFADYFILRPEPLAEAFEWQRLIAPVLVLLVATGLTEELAFRGVMQRAAGEALRAWGWVLVALVFTVLQIGHGSVWHCVFVFFVALYFGWVVKKTGSILGVSLSHGLANVGLYLVFPFVFA